MRHHPYGRSRAVPALLLRDAGEDPMPVVHQRRVVIDDGQDADEYDLCYLVTLPAPLSGYPSLSPRAPTPPISQTNTLGPFGARTRNDAGHETGCTVGGTTLAW